MLIWFERKALLLVARVLANAQPSQISASCRQVVLAFGILFHSPLLNGTKYHSFVHTTTTQRPLATMQRSMWTVDGVSVQQRPAPPRAFPTRPGPAPPGRCRVPRPPPRFSTCLQGHLRRPPPGVCDSGGQRGHHTRTNRASVMAMARSLTLPNCLALIGRERREFCSGYSSDFSTSV